MSCAYWFKKNLDDRYCLNGIRIDDRNFYSYLRPYIIDHFVEEDIDHVWDKISRECLNHLDKKMDQYIYFKNYFDLVDQDYIWLYFDY
jgi:hypothetical protein